MEDHGKENNVRKQIILVNISFCSVLLILKSKKYTGRGNSTHTELPSDLRAVKLGLMTKAPKIAVNFFEHGALWHILGPHDK